MGKTEQSLRQRHYGRRREVETRSSALGQHFADCGLDNLRIQVSSVSTSLEGVGGHIIVPR